jgi:hypothetical protein
MDNESETAPLHNRISSLMNEKADLWALVTTLQAALHRASKGLDASRQDFVFTPQTQKAMGARQGDVQAAVASLRIARRFLSRDGEVIGLILENAALGGDGIRYGVTDKADPRVCTVEIP